MNCTYKIFLFTTFRVLSATHFSSYCVVKYFLQLIYKQIIILKYFHNYNCKMTLNDEKNKKVLHNKK